MKKMSRLPASIANISKMIPVKIRAKDNKKLSETKPIDGPIIANPNRITRLLKDKTVARVEEPQFWLIRSLSTGVA
jgi:hypothetical protein